MYVIVVGGGNIGEKLAKLLIAEDHDVVVIENGEVRAKELASELDALVILGDGTNLDVLKDAGVEKADALIATTGDDKTNLIACRIAKKRNIPHVVTRITEPANHPLFLELGIDAIVNTTSLLVGALHNALSGTDSKIIATLSNEKGMIMQFYIEENSKMLGKHLDKLHSEFYEPICLSRSGQLVFADGKEQLLEGDVLFMLVREEAVKKLTKMV